MFLVTNKTDLASKRSEPLVTVESALSYKIDLLSEQVLTLRQVNKGRAKFR